MGLTVLQLNDRLRTEADAYLFLEEMRWKGTPVCPHCHATEATYIEPANGVSRRTRTGAMSERRVWRCQGCRRQFSVLTGTIMHRTKISIRVWVLVIFEMCASKNGIAAREVERKYGVCPRTAWHLLHRIREAMKDDGLNMLGGPGHVVVADETLIGGSLGRMNNAQRARLDAESGYTPTDKPTRIKRGERNPGSTLNKTTVLSLIDTTTGQARSKIVPNVTGATLRKTIADRVNMGVSTLHTDEFSAYDLVGAEFVAHRTVNHSDGIYARYTADGVVTSNQAENFFSQLKRSIDGTHHHVSRTHLSRYLAEFDYRYTTRRMSDTARMERLFHQVDGRRLTYKSVAV